ncbi:MAG: amino acid ABC transporter substrate-binding protein [Desulfobaccales bacterium]
MRRLGLVSCLAIAVMFLGLGAPGMAAEKTITLGFTASQTGAFNVEAIRQINGLNLWIDTVNKAGGIKLADGTAIKVAAKFYDDESKKDRVQELYTRLISTDKADFLISPYSSPLADAAAIIAQQYKKIMITAGAAAEATHQKGYTLVYQTYTPAGFYLTGPIEVLAKLAPQAKTIAIIYSKDNFSTACVNGLKKFATSKGYKIVMDEGYDPSTTDFSPYIDKIPPGTDAVMGGGHFSDTTTLARQIYEKKVNPKLVGLLVAPPEPKFAELGDACICVTGSSQWEPLAKYSPEAAKKEGVMWFGPTVEQFIEAYKGKYHEDPSYHSAGGYAAGLILQEAILKAGSIDTDKVKEALDGEDMYTFFGLTKFDTTPQAHGLQIGHQMIVIQWQKDAQGKPEKVAVYPPAAASGQASLCSPH